MNEKTSLVGRSLSTLQEQGLVGLSRRAALYVALRVARRSGASSKRLDYIIARDNLLRKYGTLLKRNEIFRDRHKGRRCFVIGNGPSLKKQDLAPLANEITFAVNSFYLHPLVGESWQPSYYFLSDPLYFDGTVDLSQISSIAAHIPSAPFFVPFWGKDFLDRTAALPPERTYYVATCGGMEDRWREKPDFTRVTPGMQTVVQLAIMAAMYMGCSPIYLLGLDHDWLAHGGKHLNFYSEQDVESQPEGNLPGWTYKAMMEAMTIMWQHYEMLLRVARNEGIEIVNVTRGGFLDVFERGNYEQIVGLAAGHPAELSATRP
jgi:hypothetical protein